MFAVDSGFNANTVYQWCGRTRGQWRSRARPDGIRPRSLHADKVDINLRGKRLRRGVELWHIGTWPLKAEMYANPQGRYARRGRTDPPGFAHFTEALHDERYFKQVAGAH